jgi:hypothetical protein
MRSIGEFSIVHGHVVEKDSAAAQAPAASKLFFRFFYSTHSDLWLCSFVTFSGENQKKSNF